jgi:hypothetical protein
LWQVKQYVCASCFFRVVFSTADSSFEGADHVILPSGTIDSPKSEGFRSLSQALFESHVLPHLQLRDVISLSFVSKGWYDMVEQVIGQYKKIYTALPGASSISVKIHQYKRDSFQQFPFGNGG